MKIGSLFSGIGGLELGLEWAGLGKTVWQVENNEYCQKVLRKHWKDTQIYGDIRDVGKHNLEPVDLICGGFPCQPFSTAGKRQGEADDRYLWPEMVRVIAEIKPTWVIGENVSNFIKMGLDTALSNLESLNYETTTVCIPAVGLNAWHKRQRAFIIAHTKSGNVEAGCERQGAICGESKESRASDNVTKCGKTYIGETYWKSEPRVGRVATGIPNRVDRLKCLGNAVVPQVAMVIGEMIKEGK